MVKIGFQQNIGENAVETLNNKQPCAVGKYVRDLNQGVACANARHSDRVQMESNWDPLNSNGIHWDPFDQGLEKLKIPALLIHWK